MKIIELVQAHGALVAGLLYAALNLANALVKGPEAKGFIGKLIDALSILTRKEASGTLKMPLAKSKSRAGKMELPAALFPFIAVPLAGVLLASCACFGPEKKDSLGCIIVRQIIDCTVDVVKDLAPSVAGIVGSYINGAGTPDWDALLVRLEALGIRDAGCILAQLENDFITKPQSGPDAAMKAKGAMDAFAQWKAKHGISSDVKFKIMAGGKEVLR